MLKTRTSEMLHPIRKAAAFTLARVVARSRMNTTMVAGERLERSPSKRIVTTRLMRQPVSPI
jgi:hypothetical protein